jgi:hypothetical protein
MYLINTYQQHGLQLMQMVCDKQQSHDKQKINNFWETKKVQIV